METQLLNKFLDVLHKSSDWIFGWYDWIFNTCGQLVQRSGHTFFCWLHSISNVVTVILKCLPSKLFGIAVIWELSQMSLICLWLQHNMRFVISVSSAHSEALEIYDIGKKIHSGFPGCNNVHLYGYSAPVSPEVTMLLSLTPGMKTVLYLRMFYTIFQIFTEVKSATWTETWVMVGFSRTTVSAKR